MDIPNYFTRSAEHQQSSNPSISNQEYFTAQNSLQSDNQLITLVSYSENFRQSLSGFLEKITLNSQWQTRFFVVTPIRLIYYFDESRTKVKGCFNFVSLLEHQLQVQEQQPQLHLKVTPAQNESKILLKLKSKNQENYLLWKQQLVTHIRNLYMLRKNQFHNTQNNYCRIRSNQIIQCSHKFNNSIGNFWNRIDISIEQLYCYGSNLDILLFRSKQPLSYFYRFFMGSYYDHVAILVRSDTGHLLIFEAVSNRGVHLIEWESMAENANEIYEEIGYRKLISKHKIDLQVLEKYLNSLLGKRYELTFSKLMNNNEFEQNEGNMIEKQTFFCSQLVADIYSRFGLLCSGNNNKFWPKDFEDEKLKLQNEHYLTPIMNLHIS